MAWTLEYGGVEKALAAWGIIEDLPFEFASQSKSLVDIITVDDFDDAFQWAYDSRVVIRRDRTGSGVTWAGGSRWFIGYVSEPRRVATGGKQNHRYTLYDWWWLAERTPMRRIRKSYTGSLVVFYEVPPTEVVLFEDKDENPIDTQAQFLECLTVLNECWNPTRRGATVGMDAAQDVVIDGFIDTSLQVPRYPVRDTMVSEAIQQVLAWTQDAVIETDYESAIPIVSVRRAVTMAVEAVTLPADKATEVQLKPRYDLQIPGVVLYYKKIHTQDGVPGLRYYQDKYPPALSDWHPNARIHTIEMQGSAATSVRQKLKTISVNAAHSTEATRLAWWRARFPWLLDSKMASLSIPVASVSVYKKQVTGDTTSPVSLVSFPYEILDGGVTDWMEDQYDVDTPAAIAGYSDEVIIEAEADYTIKASAGVDSKKDKKRKMAYRCKLCDFNTSGDDHEFVTVGFFDPGETIWLGLAEEIYNTHQALQHEGTVTLVGADVPDNPRLGQLLTLITPGGSYENNLVQRVFGELTHGRVTFSIGPPGHLGIADMIELMRVNRYRYIYSLPSRGSNPLASSSGELKLSKLTAKENSSDGAERVEMDSATFKFTV